MPCSISHLISSSVTGGSRLFCTPSNRSTASVVPLSKRTKGAETRASQLRGRAIAAAMVSGWSNARCLGTSSPKISDRKVIATTTTPIASSWARCPISGTPASAGASWVTSAASP
jgi:hypothetical protein